ncbi:MAG TPA: hypothetical protein VMG30_02915 [Acidobacteriota bacterium]|nr:hypothetical protein [Acidobacteriota bacterium]
MRNRAITFPLQAREGLQMIGDNSIKRIIFRIPGVAGGLCITNEETFCFLVHTIAHPAL